LTLAKDIFIVEVYKKKKEFLKRNLSMGNLAKDIAEISRFVLRKIAVEKRLPTPYVYESIFIEAAEILKKDRVLKYLMEDEKNIDQQLETILSDSRGLLASIQLSLRMLKENSQEAINAVNESTKSILAAADAKQGEELKDLLDKMVKLRGTNHLLMESLAQAREDFFSKEESLRDLEKLSQTDPLTQLLNRRSWNKKLEEEFERSHRYKRVFSVIMLDIDYFKRFNDFYGHSVGDTILKKLGALLKEEVRKIDHVFRYGGEEFTILLPETTLAAALTLAERIHRRINEAAFVTSEKKRKLKVTASLGITDSEGHKSTDTIIQALDQSLYLSKQSGRNCIRTSLDLKQGI